MIYAARIMERILYHICLQIYHAKNSYIISQGDISLTIKFICVKIWLKEGVFMTDNKLLDLSFEFSVAIVELVDSINAPKSSYMTDQLARAGTSIGANIYEASMLKVKKILFLN